MDCQCMCAHRLEFEHAALPCSPALMAACTSVHFSHYADSVTEAATRHLLMRDARHVLKQWHDDVATASLCAESRTPCTAASLLLKTCDGTASGLSFVDAVRPVKAIVVRFPGAMHPFHHRTCACTSCQGLVVGAAKPCHHATRSLQDRGQLVDAPPSLDASAAPATYAAVLARSAAKHVRAGKAASPADIAAMQQLAGRVSRAAVQIAEAAADVSAGAGAPGLPISGSSVWLS